MIKYLIVRFDVISFGFWINNSIVFVNLWFGFEFQCSVVNNRIIMVSIWHPCTDLHSKDTFLRLIILTYFWNISKYCFLFCLLSTNCLSLNIWKCVLNDLVCYCTMGVWVGGCVCRSRTWAFLLSLFNFWSLKHGFSRWLYEISSYKE